MSSILHTWDVLNPGAQPGSSLLLVGRNQETPVPSPSWTPQSGGFCADWPFGWGVWRPQTAGSSSLGVGMGRAKGLGEGTGSGPLQCSATKGWTKTRNKETNVTP